MAKPPRVVAVEPLQSYVLRLTFSDGIVRELDFARTVTVGVLATLADPETFAAVAVDDVGGTITWPSGIDFDPDVLHGDAAAAVDFVPLVVHECRLRSTA